MVTVTATEMKNKLGHYLQVALVEPVVVEKTRQQVAVLASMKEDERLTRLKDAYWGGKSQGRESRGVFERSRNQRIYRGLSPC